jgi:hypothetical protein
MEKRSMEHTIGERGSPRDEHLERLFGIFLRIWMEKI